MAGSQFVIVVFFVLFFVVSIVVIMFGVKIIGVFVVRLGGVLARLIGGGLLRVTSPAAAASAPLAAPSVIIFMSGHVFGGDRFLQRLALVRLGDRRCFDGVDDLVDVLDFAGVIVVEGAWLFTARAITTVASAATASSSTSSSASALVVRSPRLSLLAGDRPSLHFVFSLDEIVDEIGRYHFVGQQFLFWNVVEPRLGRFAGMVAVLVTITSASIAAPLASPAFAPLATGATSASIAASATLAASAPVTSPAFMPIALAPRNLGGGRGDFARGGDRRYRLDRFGRRRRLGRPWRDVDAQHCGHILPIALRLGGRRRCDRFFLDDGGGTRRSGFRRTRRRFGAKLLGKRVPTGRWIAFGHAFDRERNGMWLSRQPRKALIIEPLKLVGKVAQSTASMVRLLADVFLDLQQPAGVALVFLLGFGREAATRGRTLGLSFGSG